MDIEQAIPSWWSNPQRLFDIFKDAGLEFLLSIVFGLVGYAIVKTFAGIPWFGEKRGHRRSTRMWIPTTFVPLVVGVASAWRYNLFMTPARVPGVKVEPSEYIFLMTLVVAVAPGFIILPMVSRFMKKRGSNGDTSIVKREEFRG